MASGISSLGVGSNLDLSSLLDNLRSAEQTRLAPMQRQKASANTELSAYASLASALTGIQNAADALNDASLYRSSQSQVSGDAVSIEAKNAFPGRHEVEVSQLARAQSLASQGVADKTAAIGNGGRITIRSGDDEAQTIELPEDASSLDDIREAINQADLGVSASIIEDGSDKPFRLVLSVNETGAENGISIEAEDATTDGSTPLGDLLNYAPDGGNGQGMRQTVAPADALFSVNGISIRSDSNTVDNAIAGVTLTLNATTEQPAVITSRSDSSATKSAIEGFVSAYNRYQTIESRLTAFSGDAQTSGVLLGDGTTRTIDATLRRAFSSPGEDGAGVLPADIGLSFDNDGRLEIDEDKLDTALADNPTAARDLFAGKPAQDDAEDGIAGGLASRIGAMLEDDGLLGRARSGLTDRIDRIDGRLQDMQRSVDDTMSRYRKEFEELDVLMNQLNSTQSYLTTQLAALDRGSDKS